MRLTTSQTVFCEMLLKELEKQLAEVIQLVPQIIVYFKKLEYEKAYAMLIEFLETAEEFAKIFSEDLGWVYGDTNETANKLNEKLECSMIQLVGLQEEEFQVSICSLMMYEIVPILKNWQKIIGQTISALPTPKNK